jgi:hypothetical protein
VASSGTPARMSSDRFVERRLALTATSEVDPRSRCFDGFVEEAVLDRCREGQRGASCLIVPDNAQKEKAN